MADKQPFQSPPPVAPRRADADLQPFDPAEGSGQRFSPGQRSAEDARAKLAAARIRADEEHKRAQADIRAQQRALAETELAEQRKVAMRSVDEQEQVFAEQSKRMPSGGMMIHPAWLEMEAARSRAVADALQQDETVPGGIYSVDGRLVDADGRALD